MFSFLFSFFKTLSKLLNANDITAKFYFIARIFVIQLEDNYSHFYNYFRTLSDNAVRFFPCNNCLIFDIKIIFMRFSNYYDI